MRQCSGLMIQVEQYSQYVMRYHGSQWSLISQVCFQLRCGQQLKAPIGPSQESNRIARKQVGTLVGLQPIWGSHVLMCLAREPSQASWKPIIASVSHYFANLNIIEKSGTITSYEMFVLSGTLELFAGWNYQKIYCIFMLFSWGNSALPGVNKTRPSGNVFQGHVLPNVDVPIEATSTVGLELLTRKTCSSACAGDRRSNLSGLGKSYETSEVIRQETDIWPVENVSAYLCSQWNLC